MKSLRIGFGFDVHELLADAHFVLGGIAIPSDKGAVGYSDADVLIHAIIDALLGACSLGDIGRQFPDTEEKYKGIDSKFLLQKVMKMARKQGYGLSNLDATVCLQEPKIAAYIPAMTKTLSEVMQVHPTQISIKATTTEGLGYIGAGQGVSAYAVVLMVGNQ